MTPGEVFPSKRRPLLQELQQCRPGAKAARVGVGFLCCWRAEPRCPGLISGRVERFVSGCQCFFQWFRPWGFGLRFVARAAGPGRLLARGFPARVCSGGSSAQRDCRGEIRSFGSGSLRQAVLSVVRSGVVRFSFSGHYVCRGRKSARGCVNAGKGCRRAPSPAIGFFRFPVFDGANSGGDSPLQG
jgi:hypothetical protein